MLVVFLQHEHVIGSRGPEPVAPDLVRAHRRVRPDVEEGPAVGCPGGAVIDAVHHVIQVPTRRQIAKAQLVQLSAVDVGGVRDQVLVGASLDITQLEIVMSTSELVGVEDDFLGSVH